MPVLFKDLYKPFKDFQTKEFNGAKSKVTVKSVASDKTSFEANAESVDGKLAGDTTFEFPLHLVVPFKIKSVGKSAGDFEVTATFPGLVPGLDVEAVHSPSSNSVTAHYRHDQFNSTVAAKQVKAGVAVEAAAVGKVQQASVGAKVDFLNNAFSGVTGGAIFAAPDYQLGLLVDMKNAKVGWLSKIAQYQVGAEVEAALAGGAPSVGLVGASNVNGCAIKAKVHSKGVVSLSASRKVCDNVKAVWASEIKSGGTHVWGLSLTLE